MIANIIKYVGISAILLFLIVISVFYFQPNLNFNLDIQANSTLLLLLIPGLLFVGFGIWYLFFKNNSTFFRKNIVEEVSYERAYKLMISEYLKTKAKDIPARAIEESDGYMLLEPVDDEAIIEYERYPDVNRVTGVKFIFSFIQVNVGKCAGLHLLGHSISYGEEYMKKGLMRVESNTWSGKWTKRTKTFNMSSPEAEKTRLKLLGIEALSEGDDRTSNAIQSIISDNPSSKQQYNVFDDEDDEEMRQRLKLQNQMNPKTKKNKKRVQNRYNQPNTNLNYTGGQEE